MLNKNENFIECLYKLITCPSERTCLNKAKDWDAAIIILFLLLRYSTIYAQYQFLRIVRFFCSSWKLLKGDTNGNKYLFIIVYFFIPALISAQPRINRRALTERHNVVNSHFDSLSSLSVGNGGFAFTVDVSGLQSYPDAYSKGVPLGTESEWGWHSFINTHHYTFDETLKDYFIHGRNIPYSVELKQPARAKEAVEWFRQNPHRLQLGNIGLIL